MEYFEIEGKLQLQRFDIPTDNCCLLNAADDLGALTYPRIVKGQYLAGKRGKAGAIRFARNKEELEEAIRIIKEIKINGKSPCGILTGDVLKIAGECYLGITVDPRERRVLMMFTAFGGMDIEDLAQTAPEKLVRLDCTEGFERETFLKLSAVFGLPDHQMEQLVEIAGKLTKAFFALDATTLEINPLAILEDGQVCAADCKLVTDDNAAFRQEDLRLLPRLDNGYTQQELEAKKYALEYVELDHTGDIGIMAGGAGIGMATVDTVLYYGGRPNNFLDLGGGVTAEKTYHAMQMLLRNPNITSIIINVFGGINDCADMAEGITRAYRETAVEKNVVVKSRGFHQEQGWMLYDSLGFRQIKYGTTDDAVQLLEGKVVCCGEHSA